MNKKIKFSPPQLQIDFAFLLQTLRTTYLQNALFETIKTLDISKVDKELLNYVSNKDIALLAGYGLRAELVFPVPCILEKNPYLIGYYRLLLGYSQKEFYTKKFGITCFKPWEEKGKTSPTTLSNLSNLCRAFCESSSILLNGIQQLNPNKGIFDDLSVLTLGAQLRGSRNNKTGLAGIVKVFEIIKNIVGHTASGSIDGKSIELNNAAHRSVFIEFSPDPDIIIREKMDSSNFRNIIAIEIKAGTDISNIHNRVGEAEKSHQKAKKIGYTECWTIVNVSLTNEQKLREESPSTNKFYNLEALMEGKDETYEDFKNRIISLTGICANK